MRRLLLLASAMVFLDLTFFTAIAPLLPTYVDELHLSTAQAGILSAAYPAGTPNAALPAGFLAASVGTEVVFSGVLFVALALAWLASRMPDTIVRERQPIGEVLRCLFDRPLVEAAIFVSSPSLMFGAIDVLLPLRVNALGGGH